VKAKAPGDTRREDPVVVVIGDDEVPVAEAQFAGPLPLAQIASKCGVSERTLTRRFIEATGLTPLRYQQRLRLERAEHLIGHGATVEAAARTVGFQDARMLRRLRARESD